LLHTVTLIETLLASVCL